MTLSVELNKNFISFCTHNEGLVTTENNNNLIILCTTNRLDCKQSLIHENWWGNDACKHVSMQAGSSAGIRRQTMLLAASQNNPISHAHNQSLLLRVQAKERLLLMQTNLFQFASFQYIFVQ